MIIGKLNSFSSETTSLSKVLSDAILYLKKTDWSKKENKKYFLKKGIYLVVQEYYTQSPGKKKPEQHQKYIDLHLVLSGEEKIGISFDYPENVVALPYHSETDTTLYQTVAKEMEITISSGMYCLFYPTDIHRPGCYAQKGGKVRKVVVKIPLNLL